MYDRLPPRGAETEYGRCAERVPARRVTILILVATVALLVACSTSASALQESTKTLPGIPCLLIKFGITHDPTACRRPFSPSSPFNTPVGRHPKVATHSAQIVQRLVSWGPPGPSYAGASGTSADWSHPLYFARASDPRYRIHQTGWVNRDIEGRHIYIPRRARPAGGGDGSFTVVQPDGWEYDFYRAKKPSRHGRTFTADFGRRGRWHGSGLGTSRGPSRGGITAAGFSNQAGVIRVSEMRAGVINHALFMTVNCHHGNVWPANNVGTHGLCSLKNAPAMGQHFWLDMTPAQINALSVPGWQKIILRAMARYGMYVGDDGGNTWALQFESGDNYTSFGKHDPWIAYAHSQGIRGWYDSSIGRSVYYFSFKHAVGWGRWLKVLKP
jgi:hypothetical protein